MVLPTSSSGRVGLLAGICWTKVKEWLILELEPVDSRAQIYTLHFVVTLVAQPLQNPCAIARTSTHHCAKLTPDCIPSKISCDIYVVAMS